MPSRQQRRWRIQACPLVNLRGRPAAGRNCRIGGRRGGRLAWDTWPFRGPDRTSHVTTPCLASEDCGGPAWLLQRGVGPLLRGDAALAPEGDPLRPAVLFPHGAGGSGAGAIADPVLAGPIVARGYALLKAPNGSARPTVTAPTGRSARGRRCATKMAFLGRGARRTRSTAFPPRPQPASFVAGFSMGAGLVWQLACREPDDIRCVSRRWPAPSGVARPAQPAPARSGLLLTHGWRDDAVPLEG